MGKKRYLLMGVPTIIERSKKGNYRFYADTSKYSREVSSKRMTDSEFRALIKKGYLKRQ